MQIYLIDMLECPVCHGGLTWQVSERSGDRIEEGDARCATCTANYPIREGVGLFLTPDLPRNDLWEQAGAGLEQHLRAHPEVEHQLMGAPLAALNPADQFQRALLLEQRGEYAEAAAAAELARRGLYRPEFLSCWDSQVRWVVEHLSASDETVVDLASGRCYLVEVLAREVTQPIVASDFSPRVLRRARARLEFLGLYDRVSLLAFDARRTPFRPGAVKALTTNLGLPNIQEPGDLLGELRRIVGGMLLAISYFYPEEDATNVTAIRSAGLSTTLLCRRSAIESFSSAGWQVEVANRRSGRAKPTPRGQVIKGSVIDLLPVAETVLEWCVLVGR